MKDVLPRPAVSVRAVRVAGAIGKRSEYSLKRSQLPTQTMNGIAAGTSRSLLHRIAGIYLNATDGMARYMIQILRLR